MASSAIKLAETTIDIELFQFVIALADDHLILSHRLSQLCGHAPTLEEDLALSNIALDLIGQARTLYDYAASIEGQGRTQDDLAYLRKEHEYKNLLLVELENGDFAKTILRVFLFTSFMKITWQSLFGSQDEQLSQIADKAYKESLYHIQHSAQWVIRLGCGTRESARRLNEAAQLLGPYTGEMFDENQQVSTLVKRGVVVEQKTISESWNNDIAKVFLQADLPVKFLNSYQIMGGRQGRHTEAMGFILTELQYLQRAFPGCEW